MNEPTERTQARTILLVHSNAVLLKASREMLAGFGHRILGAADPDGAVVLAAGHDGAIDLAVVEAFPRQGSGLELVRRLRRERPGLHALLLTAYGEDPALREAVAAREVVSLAVPFSTSALRQATATALGTPAPATPAVQAAPRKRPVRRSLPVWAWAAAASLVGAVLLLPLVDRGGPPPLADGRATEVTRSLTILPVAPRGEVDTAPRALSWETVPGAASYLVQIRSVDDRLLWEGRSETAGISLDPSAVAFAPAVRYSWRVEALDREGRPVASSPRVWVLVRPARPPAQ